MNKVLYGLLAGVVAISLAGCATMGSGTDSSQEALTAQINPDPTVIIEPSHMLKLSSKTRVAIMGSGFQPGQEIRLLISHADGSISDIGSQLKPEPVANEFGVWATTWTVGRYSKSKIAKAGIYTLKACNTDYQVLATAPFGYYSPKKD